MAEKRLTTKQKQELTLRGLFEYEGAQKPKVSAEVKSFVKNLEGIVDPESGQNVLDMKIKDMDVGQVIGDVIAESPYGISDKKDNPKRRSRSQSLIIRLKTMFGQAGYPTNYVNKEVENYLGADIYEENTKMSLFRGRKTPLGFQDDIYPKLKGILQKPNLPQDVKLQFAAHLFGGFRAATLKTFDIKNFDAEKGIVSVYDAKTKKTKVAVLNPALVDIFKQSIGDRKSGPIFLDIKKNTTIINKELKNTIGEVSFLDPSGELVKKKFTSQTFRNMNETLLEDSGLGKEDRDFLNGRAQSTEAAGYVTVESRKERVDNAGREIVAKIMGYSGDSNSAQFGEDTGIKFSKKTKKIPVLSGLLKNKNYVSVLPEGFVESLPGEGNFLTDKAAESDPELTESRRQQALEKSRRDKEAAGLEADKLERERREFLLSQPELTDEEAERLAREKLTKQQASQKAKEEAKAAKKSAEFEANRKKYNKILGQIGRGTKLVGAAVAGTGVGAPVGAAIYAGGTALTLNEASDLNDDAESLRQQAQAIFDNSASTPKEKASANAMIAEADRLSEQATQTLLLPVTGEDVRTVGGVIKGAVEPALKSGIQPGFGMFGVPRVIPEEERSNIDNQLNNLMREPLRQELE